VSRPLVLIALGAMLVLAGCQRAPATRTVEHAPTVSDLDEAKQALAVANWGAAAPHLRAALQQDPDSLFLHSNLATCASWLDLTDEADREFQWVRDHAPSDSEEAATARRWLAKRGDSVETEANSAAANRVVADSGVHGIVMWGEPPVPQNRLQLFLMGLPNTPTKDGRYALRTDENGAYAFQRIPAGTYKLEVLLMMKPRWRLKLTLEPGQELVVDLTPENSVPRRDDFAPAQ